MSKRRDADLAPRKPAEQLRDRARSLVSAMTGWGGIETEDDWRTTLAKAADEYESGRFLVDRLGAERLMDPILTATIWRLRQRLAQEHDATTAAELMLIDAAVLSYATMLKLQQLIGNAVLTAETEFFGDDGPRVAWRRENRGAVADGLSVEATVDALVMRLMPLVDRANRGLIRNLQALRELKQGPSPTVAIGRVEQMNVADRQINVAGAERELE